MGYGYISEDNIATILKMATSNGLRKFCREHKLDSGHVSKIINGHKPMTDTVAKAIGFKSVTVYEPIDLKK